jgi:MscS family membrane protein
MMTRSDRSGAGCARAARVAMMVLTLVGAVAGHAREDAVGEPVGSVSQVAPPRSGDDVTGTTPRSSVRGFLEAARRDDYARATDYLHLAGLPAALREDGGVELARQLEAVLDQTLWIDPDAVSDDSEGEIDDGLAPNQERVAVIRGGRRAVPVLLERVTTEESARVWKFARSTLAQVPGLHEEFANADLPDFLPEILSDEQFLSVRLWQWLGLAALVVVAWLGSWLAARAALAAARVAVSRSSTALDDRVIESAIGPARLASALLIFSAGSHVLGLSVRAQSFVNGCTLAGGIAAAAWLALRLIDLVASVALSRIGPGGATAAWRFVPLGRKTAKAAIVVLAGLAALDSFGFDVTALIAGLGIGGLAVALALQKTLENLFSGATLLADRPVQVGDFCRFGDQLGTVEEIGMRSTRVRTLDRTVVSIPNAQFAALNLENFTRRDKIWYHPTIGLRYETTLAQLRRVLMGMRQMLELDARVEQDGARVRFISFGPYSLDLEIFAYVKATDYAEFLDVAEDLNMRVIDIVQTAGAEFAFPSNTTYLARDRSLTPDSALAGAEIEP